MRSLPLSSRQYCATPSTGRFTSSSFFGHARRLGVGIVVTAGDIIGEGRQNSTTGFFLIGVSLRSRREMLPSVCMPEPVEPYANPGVSGGGSHENAGTLE